MKSQLLKMIAVFCVIGALWPHQAAALTDQPMRWHGYIYSGSLVDNDLNEIVIEGGTSLDFIDEKLLVMGVGRELYHYQHYFTFEGEAQIGHHFGGVRNHQEFNLFLNLRWNLFPWDRWLDTSFVWGNGLSYATKRPFAEIDRRGNVSHILYYIYLGLDFVIPQQQDWHLLLGIHHRSGIFGVINDVNGGSNALVMGMKRRF